jgi:hypothetical protein
MPLGFLVLAEKEHCSNHWLLIFHPLETSSPELRVASERIARLEAENQRLAAENNALLEQFARWAYNAHTRNLAKEFLNNPLPAVDRERSKRF